MPYSREVPLEKIGVVASERCREARPEAKRWLHLSLFCVIYRKLLARYKIVAPAATAEIIQDALKPVGDPWSKTIIDELEIVGGSFRGRVSLAAQVAIRTISRVLMFQDPDDHAIERPDNYALLRNCNLAGAHINFNYSAHLWALYECHRLRISQEHVYNYVPVTHGGVRETVAFIAHDGQKEQIARVAIQYRDVFALFDGLTGTSGTKNRIDKAFDAWEVARLPIGVAGASAASAHGPSGGDVVIAEEIFRTHDNISPSSPYSLYAFWNVLFFIDHKMTHPHEPDIQVLLNTCLNPEHKVNLLLNTRMAAEWARRYREQLPPCP